MRHIYSQSCLIPAHELICICCIYVEFEGCICCWHIFGNSMVNKSCIFLLLAYAVVWHFFIDYSNIAVGYAYVMWQAYLFRAYANNMICIPPVPLDRTL